jgi:hypothetical protein
MKRLFIFLSLLTTLAYSEANAAPNAIRMAYNFTTVSQTVVFDNTMRAGGTFTLSTQAMDGGGRAPGDPFTIKMVFYSSSNAIINTAQLSNTLVYGATTPATYTTTTTNCGGSCATVAYVKVEFYGKDGGFWAGNYGPYIINPSLSFNDGPNILYNPEFGIYGTNGFAQGWTSTAGWQNCALYSGSATCVVNNGAPVNGGTYSASGGSTSGSAGGYTAGPTYPSYMTVGSNPGTMTYGTSAEITTGQQTRVNTFTNRTITNNSIYIDQVGDNNSLNVTQVGRNNEIKGVGQQASQLQGNSNTIVIRQGDSTTDTGKNSIEMRVIGNSNNLNINQSKTSTGTSTNSTNGHYQLIDISGYTNVLTTQQTNTGGVGGHYMETTITGNTNNVITNQKNNGNKIMFTTVSGNNNTVTAVQEGTGQHYLESTLIGNSNTVTATQSGNTQNKASISITNAGGPGSVDLQQSGGANYNITTTCVTAGGCGTVTIRQ